LRLPCSRGAFARQAERLPLAFGVNVVWNETILRLLPGARARCRSPTTQRGAVTVRSATARSAAAHAIGARFVLAQSHVHKRRV